MLSSLLIPTSVFSAIAALGVFFPIPDLLNVASLDESPRSQRDYTEEIANEELIEEPLASFEGAFRCTIYYTPKESGFTADGGFDMTQETRPGLEGRKFARDFLLAVQKEGYGRLNEGADGFQYISYCRGAWRFAGAPMDCRGKPLVPKTSCAVKTGHKLIRPEDKLRVTGPHVPEHFESLRWVVSDTGSGLNDGQIDFYWGEDDPSGPGKKITFPKCSNATIEKATIIVLR